MFKLIKLLVCFLFFIISTFSFAGTIEDITFINKKVNSTVKYQRDIETYGLNDYWTFPVNNIGDCEDFAIAKQELLSVFNIKSNLVCCWLPNGKYHVVLAVETDKGSFILDDRYPGVIRYEDLKYKWHKIEQDNLKWFKIIPGSIIKIGKETTAPKGYVDFKKRDSN